jgi:hypothetical protein
MELIPEPDSRALVAAIHVFCWLNNDVNGRTNENNAAMTIGVRLALH